MKNLFMVIMSIVTLIQFSCKGIIEKQIEPATTIADLNNRQSVFADSLITLENVRVTKCESVLNYSKAIITDDSGEDILLLTPVPYRKGEIIDIAGKLYVVYQDENQRHLVFVDERLKPAKELVESIMVLMGF
ncbi:MAG: hypothetical protein WD077_05905 [Bacteroidia bacterium]